VVMMLDYIYGHDQAIANFVATLIPHCRRGFGPNCKAIGVIDVDGNLIAGMVYHNWDPDAALIEMSGASLPLKYWLTRETLARIYQYPFHQCGCQMVVMRVRADNEMLLGVLARLNYAFSKVPRLFGRDVDGVVCTLTREAWEDNHINARFKHHIEPLKEAA
jgi:RimJ/RimL family protein N-acetyltransferase